MTRMSNLESLRSILRITLAEGVGPVLFRRLTQAFDGIDEALEAGPKQWSKVKGIGPKILAGLEAVSDATIDEELALADKLGVTFLMADDECFPPSLKQLVDCSPLLYVRGRLIRTDATAIGVVGSRNCTHYGLEQASRFGGLLGQAGFTVASGGARGIDTSAHRGALDAGGRTVAVMGCGLATLYPPENVDLFDRMVTEDRGAIISELPLRTEIRAGHFHSRNRIISGMSLGVLVVEAARRSGSLITARQAAQQNREVFAIPGHVDSPLSAGTNELIREGAILTTCLEDMLEHLGPVGETIQGQIDDEAPAPDALPANLAPTELTLLTALKTGGAMHIDALTSHTGLESGVVISAMTMLVLKGHIAQQPGNVFAFKSRS
jgi:DNA processing protein